MKQTILELCEKGRLDEAFAMLDEVNQLLNNKLDIDIHRLKNDRKSMQSAVEMKLYDQDHVNQRMKWMIERMLNPIEDQLPKQTPPPPLTQDDEPKTSENQKLPPPFDDSQKLTDQEPEKQDVEQPENIEDTHQENHKLFTEKEIEHPQAKQPEKITEEEPIENQNILFDADDEEPIEEEPIRFQKEEYSETLQYQENILIEDNRPNTQAHGISSSPYAPPPKNYLIVSILALVLCCNPIAIVAIVYASQVDQKYRQGDLAGAQQASDSAKKWLIITGIAYAFFVVVWFLLAAIAG